jgi:hypothetical protein
MAGVRSSRVIERSPGQVDGNCRQSPLAVEADQGRWFGVSNSVHPPRRGLSVFVTSPPLSGHLYSVQVAAIIFTLSTFSCGRSLPPPLLALAPGAAAAAFPVISTFLPTCSASFFSSASSRYDAATGAAELEPAVPVGLIAFERMNAEASAAPAPPAVPIAPGALRSRHPVTVRLSAGAAGLASGTRCVGAGGAGACEGGGGA